jgi:hypothetical protein
VSGLGGDDQAPQDDGVLNYRTKSRGPRRLHLSEEEGAVVVTFATPPEWLWVVQFAVQIAAGLMHFGAAMTLAALLFRMGRIIGTPVGLSSLKSLTFTVASFGLMGIGWFAAAGYSWWSRRRGAWEARTLTATHEALTLRWFGWLATRQTVWAATSIAGIELRLIKGNLNWKRTVADLYLRFHTGRRRRFRLSSPDRLLPERIARRLAETLGVPLRQK